MLAEVIRPISAASCSQPSPRSLLRSMCMRLKLDRLRFSSAKPQAVRWLLVLLQLLFDGAFQFLIAPAVGCDFKALLPGLTGRLDVAQGQARVGEVVVDFDVLGGLVLEGLLQDFPGLAIALLAKQHPAETVQVGAVVVLDRFLVGQTQ